MHATLPAVSLACLLAAAPAASAAPAPPAGTRYLHADHRGDVALATDANGIPVGRNVHRAWGGKRPLTSGEATARRTYDGWEDDRIAGLLYAGARWYDHRVGRFLSVDPVRQAIYAALAASPPEHVDPDGRVWYRYLTARGTPAFRLGANMRYERVVAQWELRAVPAGREARHPTDVYVHVKDLDDRLKHTWDRNYLNGIIRRDLCSLDRRMTLVEAYIERRRVPPALGKRLRITMNQWMVRHRTMDDGSALPLAGATNYPKPPSARPAFRGRRGATLRRFSRLPNPRPGVSVVRPDPVRGRVRRGPRAVAVRQPVFRVIAREAMERRYDLPPPFVLDPPPPTWPQPASRTMLFEWGWGPGGIDPRRL